MIRVGRTLAAIAAMMIFATAAPATAGNADLVIEGSGWGHGIGMSQYGAYGHALAGESYVEILDFYYDVEGQDLTSTASDPVGEPFWIGLEQEASKIVLKPVAISGGGQPTTMSRGTSAGITDTEPVSVGQTVAITFASGQCTYAIGSGAESDPGGCFFDLEWDGWDPTPTTAIQLVKHWEWGSDIEDPTAATTCSRWSGTVCTYDYGALHVRPDNNRGLDVSLEIRLDDYVTGIGEVPASWSTTAPEALKAQAVAARTYARYISDKRVAAQGVTTIAQAIEKRNWCWCTLYDSSAEGNSGKVNDQVYRGRVAGITTGAWKTLANATAGEVVLYQGSPIAAFYGSSNGGATENNEDIWSGAPIPYLRSRSDPLTLSAPGNAYSTWGAGYTVSTSTLEAKLNLDDVYGVDIVDTYDSGTPSRIEVTGSRGGSTVVVDDYPVGSGSPIDGVAIQSWYNLRGPHITGFGGDLPEPPPTTDVDRWWGPDRYSTAADVSQAQFPSGTEVVIIATGLNYPDALAAASLAKIRGAPVLLVKGGEVPAATLAEVQRLNPSQIFILGGTAAVPNSAEHVLDQVAPVTRLAGPNRYATAIEISRATHSGPVDTVFLAAGTTFVDALVTGPVAASLGDALLLTPPTKLDGAVASEIRRLSPSKIVVVGGGTIIAQSVVDQLAAYADTVESVSGSDRYATSALMAQYGFAAGADTVLIATGALFPDALSASGVAGGLHAPVLLVSPTALPSVVATELVRLNPSTVRVLGGSEAVAADVLQAIADLLD